MKLHFSLLLIFFVWIKIAAQNVGIGVTNPDVNLTILKDIRIDAENANNGSINNSIRFGSDPSGEYILSKRTSGNNQYGLDFFTAGRSRISIGNNGDIFIGKSQASNLLINGGLIIDSASQNLGTLNYGIRFGSAGSGEGIASNRNSGPNQYGLDFYTGSNVRMQIGLDGVVKVDNKPVLVTDIFNGGRQKIMTVDAGLTGNSINPGFQNSITLGTFTFNNISAAFIGGFTSTSGECNKVLVTTEIVNVTTNSFNIKLHVSNISSLPISYNGRWKLVLLGGY